jgi:ABC-type transport system involved in cytochrome bd biosynthesis fused ATPase/permease subunit
MAEVHPEVVDFIFEQGRSAADRQLRDLDSLDSKATQLFSAATVIVGLAGFSGQAHAGLLTLAVITYVLVALAALYALWLVQIRVTDSPQQLLSRYWTEPLTETKYAMVTDMAEGFDENERSLGRKRRGVLAALALTGLETALVGAAVISNLWE